MKHLLRLAFAVVTILSMQSAFAQQRYLDEVFSNVTVTSNIQYEKNYAIDLNSQSIVLDSMYLDFYEPTGDSSQARPLIIYLHTGSFLPVLVNGTPTGDRHDSATVEMCKDFAKHGYAVACIDYRLGWNPLGQSQDIRTGTLIQAVYRALQDQRTTARFFRMNQKLSPSTYRIDTNKIAIVGQGSGGYVALGSATLFNFSQIEIEKFIASDSNSFYHFVKGEPYINEAIFGDFDGIGGFLNVSNYPGYSSAANFVVNMGGALGDSSWLVPGNIPMVCFHSINDPFAPYIEGIVEVPTTHELVVEVIGSYSIERLADQYGNNNVFKNLGLTDPYTARANQINNGYEGLFPFELPDPSTIIPGDPFHGQAGPWEWVSLKDLQTIGPSAGKDSLDVDTIYTGGLFTNPAINIKAHALAYIDTIQNYTAPRMAAALGLVTGINNVNLFEQQVRLFPNPAVDYFNLKLDDPSKHMQFVQIYDMSGRLVRSEYNIKSDVVKVERKGMINGMYMLRIGMDGKVLNGKLLLE